MNVHKTELDFCKFFSDIFKKWEINEAESKKITLIENVVDKNENIGFIYKNGYLAKRYMSNIHLPQLIRTLFLRIYNCRVRSTM